MGLSNSNRKNADEMYGEMGQLSAASRARYGSYDFVAGYYEIVICQMFADLPKRRQRELIVRMRECRERLERETAGTVE